MTRLMLIFLAFAFLLLTGCSNTLGTVSKTTPTPKSSPAPIPSIYSSPVIPSVSNPSSTSTPEKRVVSMLEDDLYTSREGTLKNGRKYVFYGTDKQSFSIKKYIEKFELVNSDIYDVKNQEKTIEAVAERVQVLFHMDNATPKRAGITIYYDGEIDALMFLEDYYGAPLAGGLRMIVIDCKDGLTTMYSSRYC